jgi:hypothetical protein
MIASSVAKSVARSVASSTAGIASGSSGLPSLPFNSEFVIDDLNNYVVNNGGYVIAFLSPSISLLIEDGSNNPRSLVAADISRIAYWQLFAGIRATPGSIEFTAVDLASAGAAWVSGGIFDSPAGTLRIDLPIHALVGDPDQIEIEITPVSGTVVIDNPIVNV